MQPSGRTKSDGPPARLHDPDVRLPASGDVRRVAAAGVDEHRVTPDAIAHLAAASVVTTWTVAYAQALRRQRQGGTGDAARSVLLDLIDRGFAGVRASMKGTPYA